MAGNERLQTIHHKYANGATLARFDYTYDATGSILTWQQQDAAAPTVFRFAYDQADELVAATKWTTDEVPALLKRYAYAYDRAANRVSDQIDDEVTGATYNTMNRLVSQQPSGQLRFAGTISELAAVTVAGKSAAVNTDNTFSAMVPIVAGTNTVPIVATDPSGNAASKSYQLTSSGSMASFTYDANGNITADGTRTFEWDALGLRRATVSMNDRGITTDYNEP
jgi:hypothetical protein